MASLLFFLLFVSDFHQGPELPLPPLSAMAGGQGPGAPRVGKGLGRSGPSLRVVSRVHSATSPAPRNPAARGIRGSGLCWGRRQTWLLSLSKSCPTTPAPPSPPPLNPISSPLLPATPGSAGV